MLLKFSEKSLSDLLGILDYVSGDRPSAAVRLVDAIEQRCKMLSRSPELGMRRDDLAPELRLFAFRGYGIYYRVLEDRVRIERVLHGALNVSPSSFE